MLFWARNFIFFASHVFPANGSVFKDFEINTAKHNNVIVQQFPCTIQIVQFLVRFKFRTADCMGVIFWDVTPCAVLVRPNIGLLYTVLSLTHSLTDSNTLSLSLSVSSMYLRPVSGHGLLYRGFTITLRHHILLNASGRVISPTQRPLPNSTQHSQEKDIAEPAGFEPTIPAIERPQTRA